MVERWLRRVRGLTRAECALLAEAQAALLAWQVRRWRRPVGRLLAAAPPVAGPTEDPVLAASLAWAVTRAARYGVFRPRCLVRALALQDLLARRGMASEIRVGVRRDADGFRAHAWVELAGRVLGDSPEYVRTFSAPADFRMVPL